MNFALDNRLDRYGSTINNEKAAKYVKNQLENLDMVDVWREINQDTLGYTWRRLRPSPTYSRLDYIFINQAGMQFVKEIKINPGYRTDHSTVEFELIFNYEARGSGYWKFNTSLLKDRDYVEKINNLIDIELEANKDLSYRMQMELLKISVRGTTLQYSARKKKAKKNLIAALDKKLKLLEREEVCVNPLFLDTGEQIRKIKHDINEISDELVRGSIVRSRVNWELHADKPTKYFLSLEKQNHHKKTIYRIKNQKGDIVENRIEVLEEIRKFYMNLYKTKTVDIDSYVQKLEIPQISEQTKTELDLDISIEEVGLALSKLKNGKSPGTDGLTADFYKCFYNKLKYFLHNVMTEIAQEGLMHLTARRGILSLLEKVGKDTLLLNSWRPLSILNTDNKVYTQIMAQRLQKALPQIIHNSQTGFIPKRHLSENILKIMELMNECDRNKQNGLLISFDFYKAFDTVEWSAMFKAFELFGFGDNYISMIKAIFNKPLMAVSNNGHWTQFEEISRGCRQGCCFSPSAFIVLVELLGLGIRQNKDIKGLKIGSVEIKAGQFADDLWTALEANSKNINEVINEIENFGRFSGLCVNSEKCAVLRLGPFKDSDSKFYTLKRLYWSPRSIRVLGIKIIPSAPIIYQENFMDVLEKVENIFGKWCNRVLTLKGKIVIVNSLVSSLFMHKFLALPTPPGEFFKRYKRLVLEFLWDGKKAKIPYKRLIQDYTRLGLKLFDLEIKNKALKAAWPSRWNDREESELNWFFETLPIKDRRVWYCNTQAKDINNLKKKDSLNVSLDIWSCWAEFNFRETPEIDEDVSHSIIWWNSAIRKALTPITAKHIINSKIELVMDIYDFETRKFFTYQQLKDVLDCNISFMDYCSILAAIPKTWKVTLRTMQPDVFFEYEYKIDMLLKSQQISKRIYWELVSNYFPTDLALKSMWELELGCLLTEDDWWSMYPLFMKLVKPSKLRLFQYRVLTKSLTTNYIRNKWDNTISPKCSFCTREQETVTHILFECDNTKILWQQWQKMIKHFFNVEVPLTKRFCLLTDYKDSCRNIVVLTAAVLKQYIYASKCRNITPTFVGLMARLSDLYVVDKNIAYNNNKTKQFYQKWGNLF